MWWTSYKNSLVVFKPIIMNKEQRRALIFVLAGLLFLFALYSIRFFYQAYRPGAWFEPWLIPGPLLLLGIFVLAFFFIYRSPSLFAVGGYLAGGFLPSFLHGATGLLNTAEGRGLGLLVGGFYIFGPICAIAFFTIARVLIKKTHTVTLIPGIGLPAMLLLALAIHSRVLGIVVFPLASIYIILHSLFIHRNPRLSVLGGYLLGGSIPVTSLYVILELVPLASLKGPFYWLFSSEIPMLMIGFFVVGPLCAFIFHRLHKKSKASEHASKSLLSYFYNCTLERLCTFATPCLWDLRNRCEY